MVKSSQTLIRKKLSLNIEAVWFGLVSTSPVSTTYFAKHECFPFRAGFRLNSL